MMDNYFISYNNKNKPEFKVPEVFRVKERFNPCVFRVSHPIALEVFLYGPDSLYYKVIEGLYMLENGTVKLKVKKQYGK